MLQARGFDAGCREFSTETTVKSDLSGGEPPGLVRVASAIAQFANLPESNDDGGSRRRRSAADIPRITEHH